jgi:hypothetical protein
MRFILAGLFLLFIPAFTFAQASGEVQSIGFGNGFYRPNCWTPMLVRLTPDTAESANYEIEVWQHDLDGDRPIYTRSIVLNGSAQASSQRFWTYFLPQPTDKGLPDGSVRDLQKDLQVFLCLPNHKQIAKLPITSAMQNIDPWRPGSGGTPPPARSAKLILAVSTNGTKQPTLNYYNASIGAKEEVDVVDIHANELPEDPIGYEGVDAIVWLDGDPSDLSVGNLDTFNALKDYVRFGGHLIVCQSTSNWQEDLGFGDMLPVDVQGLATKSNFDPLMSMAKPRGLDPDPLFNNPADTWSHTSGPYQMARSTVRPGAVVNQWIDWKQDGSNLDATPYLARKSYGLGEVTWVAQPLTTESAPTNVTAWPYIWDQVLGWKSDGYVPPADRKKIEDNEHLELYLNRFDAGPPRDLGDALVSGLDLSSKANWLILLAIVFYVVYWVISGPGTYAFLATKKRQGWSWFFFGISAMVAILVTVAVVKLVLRGPPEIKHLSFVRIAPGQPAIVNTRFGLYIPRDGDQKISLDGTSSTSVSYLSPFAEHPQQLGDVTEFPSPTEYFVPVRDLKSDTQPQLTVAYRSSLKKFQARWVGDLDSRFTGSVKLDPDSMRLPLSGTLTNASGADLTDIYLAFNVSGEKDWMIYIPEWKKGATYDVNKDLANNFRVGKEGKGEAVPGEGKILSDELASKSAKLDIKFNGWINYWYSHLHDNGDDPNALEDAANDAFPMLSVFDRLPAMPNSVDASSGIGIGKARKDRVELYNRGAAMLNASQSIADGQLLILATAKGALPIPLMVDDEKMTGDGTNYYQFILPMDRGKLDQPTTHPSK